MSITAAVESEVTLQCEVENQSGRVQWTKDGYALGKERRFVLTTFKTRQHGAIFFLHV